MNNNRKVARKIKELIYDKMKARGVISTDEVIALIKPYYDIEPEKAVEQILRKRANRYMSNFRDDNGVRACFAFEDENGYSQNVHVELTRDKTLLDIIDAQLEKRITGLIASRDKIARRRDVLEGQLTLFDTMPEQMSAVV